MNQLKKTIFAKGTPDEATQQFEYDGAGNQTAVIDENGNRTEYQYDVMNHLIKETAPDPDGSGPLTKPVTSYEYDKNGNQVLMVDPLLRRTEYRYDSRNRLVETVNPDGTAEKMRYDADNNLTSVIDPINNRTNFVYDARSRLIRKVDPLSKITRYDYNSADELIQQTDRNNRVTQFKYDELSRLKTETWVGTDQIINYNYDKAHNPTSVKDKFSNLTMTYDSRNRPKTADNTGTPNAPKVLLNYTYDKVGNVDLMTDTINGQLAGTNDYTYDARSRMTQINQSGTGVSKKRVDFAYNKMGQFSSINRYADSNGTQLVVGSNYTYDSLNRLTNLTHRNSANSTVSSFGFQYDQSSLITQIADVDGQTNYLYDKRNQLTAADHTNTNHPDESYSYDNNGNRISSQLHGSSYQTTTNNRLQSDGTYNYSYDDEGNLIRRQEISSGKVRDYQWDYRNRLVGVVDKNASNVETQRMQFTYDTLGRRIAKSVNGAVTSFVYDGDNVLLDFVDADGVGSGQPVLDKRYLHGVRVDQVLAQEGGNGNVTWQLTDHLGTVRDLVNNSGSVVNHLTYDSFGRVVAETNSVVDSRYLFTGREFDEETGLYYYRARFYDDKNGRFISEDPIGFQGGDRNLFRYVLNNPMNWTDPWGLDVWIEGPSGENEPFGHLSINVGDPFGKYTSFSFGLNGFLGRIYIDDAQGGKITDYAKTTREQDNQIYLELYREFLNDKGTLYGLYNCRTYSNEKFEEILKKYNLVKSTPPPRIPAPWNWGKKGAAPLGATSGASSTSTRESTTQRWRNQP
jgi:RHS repeat-associated protein